MKLLWFFFSTCLLYHVVHGTLRRCKNLNDPKIIYYKISNENKPLQNEDLHKLDNKHDSEEVESIGAFRRKFKEFIEEFGENVVDEWDSHEIDTDDCDSLQLDSDEDCNLSVEKIRRKFKEILDVKWASDENSDAETFRRKFVEFMEQFRDKTLYSNDECVTFKEWNSYMIPPLNTIIV